MVARAAWSEQAVDINLRAVAGELDELPRRPAEMDRYGDWGLDWADVMARLDWLTQLEAEGRLEPGQRTRYEALLRRLRDCLPLTRELDLPVPEKVLAALRAPERQGP